MRFRPQAQLNTGQITDRRSPGDRASFAPASPATRYFRSWIGQQMTASPIDTMRQRAAPTRYYQGNPQGAPFRRRPVFTRLQPGQKPAPWPYKPY